MKKKYIKDRPFWSVYLFVMWIEEGLPVYYRHKFLSSKFVEHWSIAQIRKEIKFKNLYYVRSE